MEYLSGTEVTDLRRVLSKAEAIGSYHKRNNGRSPEKVTVSVLNLFLSRDRRT